MNKKIIALITCLVFMFSSVPSFAQSTYCGLSYINITVNEVPVAYTGDMYLLDDGQEVPFSVLYEGTTYVPMRKLAEILGKNVSWDADTYTATITTPKDSEENEITPAQSQKKKGEMATVDAAWNLINITVDGNQVAKKGDSYKLDNGKTVPFSLLYKGTTYLPLRKLSEIIYKEVSFESSSMTAMINEAEIIPIIGYENSVQIPDFGNMFGASLIESSVYENLMSYSYKYVTETETNLNKYKSELERIGFKKIDTQNKDETTFSQEYWVYSNERTGEIVGLIVTTVKESNDKVLSVLLGKDNPLYEKK